MYYGIVNRKIVAGILGVMAIAGTFTAAQIFNRTSYTVSRVIDGDTFETTEKQRIRIAAVEAPELELCGAQQAKQTLEKLILGKKIQMKIIFRDPFQRLVSFVYVDKKFVNQEMLKSGWTYYKNRTGQKIPELENISDALRKNKKGIFGEKCTQSTNKINPTCTIKGNILLSTGEKTYHYLGCGQYGNTQVQLYLGDRWFCTAEEADENGFKKGKDCL